MDLFDWYYKQVVSPGELSAAFEAVDHALRTMVTTLGISGLAVGGDVVPTTPTAGISAAVKGPILAYDDEGNRIFLPAALSAVDLTQDENGAATAVFTPGQERYLGIFVRFTRELTDPRTDGDGNQVMFARLEGAELVVAAGAPAPSGAASRPALRAGHVLLADARITTGQTQVLAAHILTDRTQYLFRASSGQLNIWGRTFPEIVQKILDRFVQFMSDASQQFLTFGQQSQETYNTFVQTVNQALAAMIKHARDLPFAAESGISASNVQDAIVAVKNSMPGTQSAANTPFDPSIINRNNVQAAVEEVPNYMRSQSGAWTGPQTFDEVRLKTAWMDNWLRIRGDILYVNNLNVEAPKIQRVSIPLNSFVPYGQTRDDWTREAFRWVVTGEIAGPEVASGTFTYSPPYNAIVRRFFALMQPPANSYYSVSTHWIAADYAWSYDNGGGIIGYYPTNQFPWTRMTTATFLYEWELSQDVLPGQRANVQYQVSIASKQGLEIYGFAADLSIPGPT